MDILVACEESQRVTIELRKLGHNAYSCDVQDCSGDHPEWHIKDDVLKYINGECCFKTMDGYHHIKYGRWDMIVAFPPCTYLSKCCNKLYNEDRYGEKAVKRKEMREDAVKFFMKIVNADCDKIAIENPVGVMSTRYRKPDQIIQPYMFGEPYEKMTCLWLKGLPQLTPTDIVEPEPRVKYRSTSQAKWFDDASRLTKEERSKVRSKTFKGVAEAMAHQWGKD